MFTFVFVFLLFLFFLFLFFLFCQDLYEKLLCIVDTAFLLKIKFYLSIYLSTNSIIEKKRRPLIEGNSRHGTPTKDACYAKAVEGVYSSGGKLNH